MRQNIRYFTSIILIAMLFFALAKISLTISFIHSNVTLFWLPSGFSIAILLLFGFKYLPAIAIGAFAANYLTNVPLGFVLLATLANIIEPSISSFILSSKLKFNTSFARLRDVFCFLFFAVFLSPILSAIIGAFALCLNNMLVWDRIFEAGLSWWFGDAFGILTLGALILVWSKFRINKNPSYKKIFEGLLLLLLLIAIQTIIYFDILSFLNKKPVAWIIFPFLIWTAIRFNRNISLTFTCIAILIAVIGTINNHGPFSSVMPNVSLLLLYSFVSIVMINTLVFSALMSESAESESKITNLNKEREILFNITDDFIWSIDRKFNLVFANEAFIERMRTITGSPIQIGSPILTEDFPSEVLKLWRGLYERAIEGEVIKTEFYSPAIGFQSESYSVFNLKPIYSEGIVVGVACFGRDITGKKQAEINLNSTQQKLKDLVESTDGIVWEADATTFQFTSISSNVERLLGYPVSNWLEKGFWEANIFEEDREKAIQFCEMQTRISLNHNFEYRFVAGDGRIVWIRDIVKVVLEKGNPKLLRGLMIDITESKLAEENLIKMKVQAEAASKAKSEFLANMSHEIRTPLNAVIGFTKLIEKQYLDETQKKYLNIINQSGSSLLDLLNDVLDFAKVETGKITIYLEKVDLFEFLESASGLLSSKAIQKEIEFLTLIPQNTPRFIWVDSIRLRQILINLISNAIKFTERGKVEIKIEAKNYNPETEISEIVFEVKDTGIGISKENHSKIFEAFSQVDSSNNRKYGGTGLGLTIANELLGFMGSQLNVESEFGVGSRFYFSLNTKVEYSQRNSETKKIDVKENDFEILSNQENKFKILVVDDDEINLILIKTVIKTILPNSILLEAKDGQESVQQFKNESPDMIFMDIQMPEMNGYEATQEIRKIEQNKNIPIIAVTAGILSSIQEKCLESGMNDFTEKPITKSKIEVLINKWLVHRI